MKEVITQLRSTQDRLNESASYYERQGAELILKGTECLEIAKGLRQEAREFFGASEVVERYVEEVEGPTK